MRQRKNNSDNILKFYHIYPTHPLGQDMTQGQLFKAEFNRFEFRVFLLLVDSPRLKNLICPTIYP